jgi:hypothetical protein
MLNYNFLEKKILLLFKHYDKNKSNFILFKINLINQEDNILPAKDQIINLEIH